MFRRRSSASTRWTVRSYSMTARCMAMGERQPVRRRHRLKVEVKAKVERNNCRWIEFSQYDSFSLIPHRPFSTFTSAYVLNTRVPLVPLIILPISTLPASGARQCLHQFDLRHILGLSLIHI